MNIKSDSDIRDILLLIHRFQRLIQILQLGMSYIMYFFKKASLNLKLTKVIKSDINHQRACNIFYPPTNCGGILLFDVGVFIPQSISVPCYNIFPNADYASQKGH